MGLPILPDNKSTRLETSRPDQKKLHGIKPNPRECVKQITLTVSTKRMYETDNAAVSVFHPPGRNPLQRLRF